MLKTAFARNAAVVASATLCSRLLAFLRDAGMAALLGAGGLSDAFFAAITIPNLFRRLLAENALNSAFVPLWLRLPTPDRKRMAEEIFGFTLLALGAFTLAGIIFAPALVALVAPGFEGERHVWATQFLPLALPYVIFAGVVAIATAILNAAGRVAAPAGALIAFNIILLASLAVSFAFGLADNPRAAEILSVSFALAGVVQLAIVGMSLLKIDEAPRRPRLQWSANTGRFFARLGPGLVAAAIPQLALIAVAMIASSSPAAMSWLQYAVRLYELPLGIISVVIASVIGPAFVMELGREGQPGVAAIQSRAIESATALALPAAIGLGVLSELIVAGLFQRGAFTSEDTRIVAGVLAILAIGLPGHVLEKIFAAISFAHEDTRSPMVCALCALAVAVGSAMSLFPIYGPVGLAIAVTSAAWTGAIMLGCVVAWRRWLQVERQAARRLARIAVACVTMGAILFLAREQVSSVVSLSQLHRIALLIGFVSAGLVVYVVVLRLLRVVDWSDPMSGFRANR